MKKFNLSVQAAEQELREALESKKHPAAAFAAQAAIWLEACDYPGLKTLQEALADEPANFVLKRGVLGIDLHNVSCAIIGEQVVAEIKAKGRALLSSVRHGLFLLPSSVIQNFGIGCPVDPGFQLGGERTKNPYVEKLALATAQGINIDEDVWQSLVRAGE
jgi:hypothetical protein